MNNTLKCILMSFVAMLQQGTACDICNIYDYTSRQNKSFLGVFYRYRVMNGYSHIRPESHKFFHTNPGARVDHDLNGNGFFQNKTNKDFQRFHVVDLRFNYAIKEKLNLGFIVPLLFNEGYFSEVFYDTRPVSDSTIQTKGLGDILIFSDYVFSWQNEDKRAFIKPGIALKLPTGRANLGANGQAFPHELQTGTGSFDFILRLNANARANNWGVEYMSSYRVNTSHNDYTFGNSLNISLNPYHVIDITEDFSIVPKLGGYTELAAQDKTKDAKQINTGGKTLYGNVGIDLLYNNFNIQTLFQKPLYDRLRGQQLGNAGRIVLGVVYTFD